MTIPIVGQPFTFKGGFHTVQLQCSCEAHEPVLLVGIAPSFCPACARGFACVGFTFAKGQIDVQIMLVAPKPAEAERPALALVN